MRRLRRDEDLVGVAREVRHKDDGRIVLVNDPPAIVALGLEDVLKEAAARRFKVAAASAGFCLDGLEDKVGRVNLAVRVRVRDADDFALVLENENVINVWAAAEINVLFLPHRKQGFDFRRRKLRERQVVFGAVTDDACDAARGAALIDARGRRRLWRVEADARMIVVEYERLLVSGIDRAAHTTVARTEITIADVFRQRLVFVSDGFADPRAVL